MTPKIYLETTLFNYYYLNDITRQSEINATKKLFEEIKDGKFAGYISGVVAAELKKCRNVSQRKNMLDLIDRFNIIRLGIEDYEGYEDLAGKYILSGAIPAKKRDDAFHIAVSSLSGMDILASWNCDHIVKFKTQQIVSAINKVEGINVIAINTPQEVINDEDM